MPDMFAHLYLNFIDQPLRLHLLNLRHVHCCLIQLLSLGRGLFECFYFAQVLKTQGHFSQLVCLLLLAQINDAQAFADVFHAAHVHSHVFRTCIVLDINIFWFRLRSTLYTLDLLRYVNLRVTK